nr:hypothetical protein [Tanacetum cinerariifolium]
MSAHYSDTTYTSIAPVEVLRKQTAYTIQSVRHQPGPGHPNTIYYSDFDESDEDEPSEVIEVQRSIHHLSGGPTPSSNPIVESLSLLPTSFEDSDSLLEETDTLLSQINDSFPEYETFCFDESDEDEPSEVIEVQRSIHHLSGGPTPSSNPIVESLSPLPTSFEDSDSLLEETDTLLSQINDSFPEYETFCFNIEEKISGSTTTQSDYSLSDYEALYFDDDHIEE